MRNKNSIEPNIINGKEFADNLCEKIKTQVSELKEKTGITPALAVVIVGEDPASKVYVKNKVKRTEAVGMKSIHIEMDIDTTEQELLSQIDELNQDDSVHGILVQLPLPKQIDEQKVITAINPEKDVDGFHPINIGKLWAGENGLTPCTPQGCLMLIKNTLGDLSGKKAVIVGRSNIVGKPMMALLLKENCTVTITHSRTQNLPEICKQADILVVGIGKPQFVKKEWVKQGAVVIDVGINRIATEDGKTRLVGDVDFENVKEVAGAITPVPKGVGPMTIACLLNNVLTCAK